MRNLARFILYGIFVGGVCGGSLAAQTTYYVSNLTGSDANPGTSPGLAKQTIQAAVTAAASGDTVSVDSTGQIYNEMVTVSGKTVVFASTNGIPYLAALTVDQPSLDYQIQLATSVKVDSVVFINGLIVTGENALIMHESKGLWYQGYDRSQVVGGNKSHVVGNVQKRLRNARNEFPVGSAQFLRPVTLTFSSDPNTDIIVKYVDMRPSGVVGLPIIDGVMPGMDINFYPSFFWEITPAATIGAAYHLELTAEGFSDFTTVADLRIIRRPGGPAEVNNVWKALQCFSYDNFIVDGTPTVTAALVSDSLQAGGAMFTYGLGYHDFPPANSIIIPPLTDSAPVFKFSLRIPPFFSGGSGDFAFSVAIDDTSIAKAWITATPTESLIVVGRKNGNTVVRVTATDLADGGRITYSTAVSCLFSAGTRLRIENPFTIPNITGANPIFSVSLNTPPLVTGNIGPLIFSAFLSNHLLANVTMSNDTLTILGFQCGFAVLTIVAVDSFDSAEISFSTSVNQICTKVEEIEGTAPKTFSLSQNYPNPFNPSTVIKFGLPRQESVRLTVYDALGKEIETLVNEQLRAGSYRVVWDARYYAAGTYFYRLHTGEFIETKKLVLVK